MVAAPDPGAGIMDGDDNITITMMVDDITCHLALVQGVGIRDLVDPWNDVQATVRQIPGQAEIHERPNYSDKITFKGDDTEDLAGGDRPEITTPETKSLLEDECTQSVCNEEQLKIHNCYPL